MLIIIKIFFFLLNNIFNFIYMSVLNREMVDFNYTHTVGDVMNYIKR